jgi:hypothetical protein
MNHAAWLKNEEDQFVVRCFICLIILIEICLPSGLLLSLVEHSSNETKTRCNSSFTNTKEESSCDQAGEILARCMAHQDTTP